DVKHLWYTNNVLDWPHLDEEGQLIRVNDNTFLDLDLDNTNPKADNGDVLLTPLLEIEIPAPSGNATNPSGGLPVLSSFNGDIASTGVSDWVDQEALDDYAISVSQAKTGGPIFAYVPLTIIEDPIGNTPVAWIARMYFRPDTRIGERNTPCGCCG
ncbi:MAG: hypothetical protein IID42_03530, partial [Planctomycetes bacterium]|nr:hypothetical protein [Planctomycetota bacterium]